MHLRRRICIASLTICHSTNKMEKYCITSTVLVNFIPFVQICRKPQSEPPALLLNLKYFPAADRFSLGVLISCKKTDESLWEAPGCYNTSILIHAVPFSLTCVQLKAEQTFFQQLCFFFSCSFHWTVSVPVHSAGRGEELVVVQNWRETCTTWFGKWRDLQILFSIVSTVLDSMVKIQP